MSDDPEQLKNELNALTGGNTIGANPPEGVSVEEYIKRVEALWEEVGRALTPDAKLVCLGAVLNGLGDPYFKFDTNEATILNWCKEHDELYTAPEYEKDDDDDDDDDDDELEARVIYVQDDGSINLLGLDGEEFSCSSEEAIPQICSAADYHYLVIVAPESHREDVESGIAYTGGRVCLTINGEETLVTTFVNGVQNGSFNAPMRVGDVLRLNMASNIAAGMRIYITDAADEDDGEDDEEG